MNLEDPTLVYVPGKNLATHLVVAMLAGEGIEAKAVEDESGVVFGAWVGELQFNRPQVFVAKKDAERAAELIRKMESKQSPTSPKPTGLVHADCEACEATGVFPAEQDGTIQKCPTCGEYMDVGGADWYDELAENQEAAVDSEP